MKNLATLILLRGRGSPDKKNLSGRLILKGVLHPASDFLLKPLLASLHNFVMVPVCGFSHHFFRLFAHATSPLCSFWYGFYET
jgi:hypothetical protein